MQSRAPAPDNKMLADLPVSVNIFNACVTINEIKNFDSQSVGSTRIAAITKDGFNMLPSDTISTIYESYIDGISTMFTAGIKDPKAKKTVQTSSLEYHNKLKLLFFSIRSYSIYYMPREWLKDLKRYALDNDTNVTAVVLRVCREFLAKDKMFKDKYRSHLRPITTSMGHLDLLLILLT
jgi:hypothetical protein